MGADTGRQISARVNFQVNVMFGWELVRRWVLGKRPGGICPSLPPFVSLHFPVPSGGTASPLPHPQLCNPALEPVDYGFKPLTDCEPEPTCPPLSTCVPGIL